MHKKTDITLTLIFNRVVEVVKIHVYAYVGSCGIMQTKKHKKPM